MPVQTKIQLRRDTAANWTTTNPVLSSGEIGYDTTSNKFKVGNGSTAWSSLSYLVSDWSIPQSINTQTGTTYTVASSDVGKIVTFSNTLAQTITVDSVTAFTAGQKADFINLNTGLVTFVGSGLITLSATPGLKMRTQYSAATLVCVSSGVYVLIGDLVA